MQLSILQDYWALLRQTQTNLIISYKSYYTDKSLETSV